jgi:hypothetical protein
LDRDSKDSFAKTPSSSTIAIYPKPGKFCIVTSSISRRPGHLERNISIAVVTLYAPIARFASKVRWEFGDQLDPTHLRHPVNN